ncbi:MAG: hypothetical protein A2Z96_07665 [Spirochaetes bacterium GWB1_48_6]|nr:MAG: hypothetical protein A2Z96_07665 [Spirochaetes bacterium GWB1_48_6]
MRFLLCLTFSLLTWNLGAQQPLSTQSFEAGILMDAASGRILWSKNPEQEIIPASLTKMITLYMAWQAMEEGRFTKNSLFKVPRETSAQAMGPDSSLMFLEEGMNVSLWDLMQGLAVDSGNDAAETLALMIGGTKANFMGSIDFNLKSLGFKSLKFYDPAGLDIRSRITAREYAEFCRIYMGKFPQALKELHNLKRFTFPSKKIPGFHTRPITQFNRNLLVGTYPGVDGLKTGYLPESGYHIATTAIKEQTRLIALILGVRERTTDAGTRVRAKAASQLLDWGFKKYELRILPAPTLPVPRVFYSTEEYPVVQLKNLPQFVLSAQELSALKVEIRMPLRFEGPLHPDKVLGEVVYRLQGKEIFSSPITTDKSGDHTPWYISLWQFFEILFQNLMGIPAPVKL